METNELRQHAFQDYILNCMAKNEPHLNNPEKQIETLSFMVNDLLNDNEGGKNDNLIGFLANIGRSLKQLTNYQRLEREKDE